MFCSVLCLLCFVRVCLFVLRGHLLGKGWPLGSRLWCLLWVCHFPIGILGQVWYLIVSIPDLCNLTYFITIEQKVSKTHIPLVVTIGKKEKCSNKRTVKQYVQEKEKWANKETNKQYVADSLIHSLIRIVSQVVPEKSFDGKKEK